MDQQVGRYRIGRKLGKGAMGVVYLAEDDLLNRQAAIKTIDFLQDDGTQREFLRTRLLRDARAAASLSHPNIVGVYDVFEQDGAAYLVLEYVDGETLADVLNRVQAPDASFTVGILRALASALDYTHSRGVVHRDIKPANIMIDKSGTPKIMDFGIARIVDARTATPTGMVMGTIEYMSPEQIKGETVDGRSDQFALAALAYRMLAGGTMFGQHSLATLAYKTVNETPPPVCARNTSLPPAADAVLFKGLAKQPQDRYATCSDFVNALSAAVSAPALASGAPTAATPYLPPSPGTSTQPGAPKEPHRNRTVLIGGIAGVAAAAILAAWALVVRPSEKPATGSAPVTQAGALPPSKSDQATVSPAEPAKTGAPAPAETERNAPTHAAAAKLPAKTPPTARQQPPSLPDAAADSGANSSDDAPGDHEIDEAPPKGVPVAALEAYRRGQELVKSHQFAPALAAFSQALALHPDWPSAVFARARTYQLSGQFAEAVPGFTQYLIVRPKGFRAYDFRGHCLLRLKQDDRAFADFEQALLIEPNLPSALYGRGQVHMHRGGYKAAIADFDAAIALSPNYGLAFRARSNAKRELGDKSGAQADLARARQLMGN
jgi:serine/threonine-protein kinase